MAPNTREDAQAYARLIMKSSGATNMKELLAISGDEWIEIDRKNYIANESCYVVVDGDIIPEDLDGAFKDAARSGVQLVIGSNNDEWNYFMEDSGGETAKEKFKSWVDDMDSTYNDACNHAGEKGKPALEELLEYEAGIVPKEYAGDENVRAALAKSGVISELWRYEILDFAERFADAGGDTRAYLWKVPSTKDDIFKSAVHAVELAYVFNSLGNNIYAGAVDPKAAAKVQEPWVNFAKTGNPSVDGVEWKPYDTGARDTMVIERDGWKYVPDPSKAARELLERAFVDDPYHVW